MLVPCLHLHLLRRLISHPNRCRQHASRSFIRENGCALKEERALQRFYKVHLALRRAFKSQEFEGETSQMASISMRCLVLTSSKYSSAKPLIDSIRKTPRLMHAMMQ